MKNTIFIFLLLFSITIFSQTNWKAILPNKFPINASGQIHGISRVSQMKFHRTNPNKVYAVSARGGLFISNDGGENYTVTPGTDFMPYARLASVCFNHLNDQTIYLGTGDHNYYYTGNGVMKSTNGGLTFTQTSLNSNRLIVDMVMHHSDTNTIVAITNSGIYKTIDGGLNWSLKTAAISFDEIKQKTPTSSTLYAVNNDKSFYRSTDFGDTWTEITAGIVFPSGVTAGNGCRIAITPADTNVVYLAMVAFGGLIYKSIDGGTNFTAQKVTNAPYLTYYTNVSTSSTQGDYNFGIGVDRVNANILYLVAHANWKSTDGGLTWTQLTNWWADCHTDMHQIFTSPYDNNKLYNVNDGGIFLSTNGGTLWTPKSDGINGYEIYHGNCSPTRKDMISIGTQDNGELFSTSTNWFTNRGGDWGSQCAFDYRPESKMVYYYQNNKRRFVDGSDATYGLPAQVTLLHDIAFYRKNPNLAFVSDSFTYKTTNLLSTTPTWTKIDSSGKKIMALHVSLADSNRLYIITNDQKIRVSTNALATTPTFTIYNLPFATTNKANITTIKSNTNIIYITSNNKVYRSINNGINWTDITYNLPSSTPVKIISDEYYSANELVFVATNNTVYYKYGVQTSWTIYNLDLPSRTTVIDMSIYDDSTSNSILRYTNYGRGVWESNFNTLRPLSAQFSSDKTKICIGESINFKDISTGVITSRIWSFPGGTPTTTTSINPIITYNTAGTFDVTLTTYNGSTNTTVTKTAYISNVAATLPMLEGFEGSSTIPDGWQNINVGNSSLSWYKILGVGGFGSSSNSMIIDNYNISAVGEKDEIITKAISLNGLATAKLNFDVAYQEYAGYFDSLKVFVSNNCGATYNLVYSKGGASLSTTTAGTNDFVPTATQWRNELVNLSAYLNQNILIKFQNVNAYGNKIYLDNININGTNTITSSAGTNGTISPTGTVSVVTGNNSTFTITPNTCYKVNDVLVNGVSQGAISNYTFSNIIANHTISASFNLIPYPITATASTLTICNSGTSSLSLSSPPSGVNFQWQSAISNAGPWVDVTTGTGGNTPIYTTPTLDASSSLLHFRCLSKCLTNTVGTSNVITITVNGPSCALSLNTKVFLTNVSSSGIMSTNLISIITGTAPFPMSDPYNVGIYASSGNFVHIPIVSASNPAPSTSNTILTNNNIVDWIFVELRNQVTAPPNFTSVVVYSKAALLKNDGTIINADGTPLSFIGASPGNYFIAIKHRNHIGFMTKNSISLPNSSVLNLTNDLSIIYGSNTLRLKWPGVYVMWAGDGNLSTDVDPLDLTTMYPLNGNVLDEYNPWDMDFDAAVDTPDLLEVYPNNGNIIQQID
jgi:photosystem II stability/assembly factor-like uncharacterized protein